MLLELSENKNEKQKVIGILKNVVPSKENLFQCLFCLKIFNQNDLRLHLKYEKGLEW